MATILIEINKGIAEVVSKRKRTDIEIVDVDLLRSGACEDTDRYLAECLSARARSHVRARYPQIARALSRRTQPR